MENKQQSVYKVTYYDKNNAVSEFTGEMHVVASDFNEAIQKANKFLSEYAYYSIYYSIYSVQYICECFV